MPALGSELVENKAAVCRAVSTLRSGMKVQSEFPTLQGSDLAVRKPHSVFELGWLRARPFFWLSVARK